MILFLDLEMNTWKGNVGELNSEIIEIGAVLMDDELRIVDTFSELVRPTHQTKLSPYCLRLTGIDRKKLFRSLPLKDVLVDLEHWLDDYENIDSVYSWNESDYRQLIKECSVKKISSPFIPFLENSYADFQKVFGMEFDWPTCGLSDAMKVFNIAHSGKAHRALNDAMDLGRLYKKMKKTKRDNRRFQLIKEQAELKKIERLNPVLKLMRRVRSGKESSAEQDVKVRDAVLNAFKTDITKTLKKYKVREIVAVCPELKDWLLVLEGMLTELEDESAGESDAVGGLDSRAVNQ